MQAYYNALSELRDANSHDYFVEPFASNTVGVRLRELRLNRPATPRLNVAIERELNQVAAWLKTNRA